MYACTKARPRPTRRMHRGKPILLLLLLSNTRVDVTAPRNYSCPSNQRYDVTEFPPRCLDCPRVIPNAMDLSLIGTVARARRAPSKFSPGLPQNATCGCWRAPADQTVEVALNASWVVSGLLFAGFTRTRWLREIQVNASADNATFIDWGTYTARNFTDAALTVFALPIRARFLRITVLRYVNHRVNESGFPLAISALVSQTEPFDCGCPRLSSGKCCPFVNMTVRNDACVWCMDPTQITTVMVEGCGQCKPGTFEHEGRCIYQRPANANNRLEIEPLFSPREQPPTTSASWSAHINLRVEDEARTAVVLFLTPDPVFIHPCTRGGGNARCCLPTPPSQTDGKEEGGPIIIVISEEARCAPDLAVIQRLKTPNISTQYLQFDRGRYTLNMTPPALHSWARCTDTVCTGALGALFLTLFDDGTFRAQAQMRPLLFQSARSNLMLIPDAASPATAGAKLELHTTTAAKGQQRWAVRIAGIRLHGDRVYVRWDAQAPLLYPRNGSSDFVEIDPPPPIWDTLRLTDGPLNATTLTIQQPVTVVRHGALTQWQASDIAVRIRYGLGFGKSPQPGDSEQVAFIVATSQRPIRLKRLSVLDDTQPSTAVTYTTPKGFVTDPTKALDLVVACTSSTQIELVRWLYQATALLRDDFSNPSMAAFAKASCDEAAAASKAYWMAMPAGRGGGMRTASRPMRVVAEFV